MRSASVHKLVLKYCHLSKHAKKPVSASIVSKIVCNEISIAASILLAFNASNDLCKEIVSQV